MADVAPRATPGGGTGGPPLFCVVAGGGTAGHLIPGLVVAEALVERGRPRSSIHFVASDRGSDRELIDPAGYAATYLPGRGIQRRLTVANLAAVWGLVRALVRALGLLRRGRPEVVLAVGGYASVACALAAVILRIPLVVTEQNARAGLANRVAGRFARASAVPFVSTDLPRSVLTGNPVRPAILEVAQLHDREELRARLGVGADRRLVLAFAGSLGSRRINEAVLGLRERWRDRSDVAIRHVVGSRDWDELRVDDLEGPDGLVYRQIRYEDAMEKALLAADVAVCRAGGSTVAELAVIGVPAILVPLPIAPRDHQRANAAELVASGAARLVPDADLDVERLADELEAMLRSPGTLTAMAESARALGRPDAARRVADLVEASAR